MSIYKSCRKMCPDFIVNDFVTNTIKTVPIRLGYRTIRVTLKSDDLSDKNLIYCAVTSLSIVSRKGCLVNIADVVVKSGPKNEKLRQIIPVHDLFLREAFFYNTVLPDMIEFQDKNELMVEVPTLIAATLDEENEAIVLHNTGWTPKYEKWVGELTQAHVFKILEEFARLHALSFAFGKEKPENIKEYKGELYNGYLNVFENKQSVKIIHSNLNEVLKLYNDDAVVKKLEEFRDELQTFLENVLIEIPEKNVLVHGDPTNNFLFCYEKSENGNVPERAKLIDWHLVKFGSPVLDLSLFLFTNCLFDDLNNLPLFLKSYYSSLKTYLKEYKYEVDDIFSSKDLDEHWKKYAKFGLAISFLSLKIITMEANKRPNASNENLTVEEFIDSFLKPPNEEFKRRIKDVIRYSVDTGLV